MTTTSNLPAARTSTTVAAREATPPSATAQQPQMRLSTDLGIAGGAGVVMTASAAFTGQLWPAVSAGAATAAVLTAAYIERRRERSRVTQRVVAPISAVADIADITRGQMGGPALPGVATTPVRRAITPTTANHDIDGQ